MKMLVAALLAWALCLATIGGFLWLINYLPWLGLLAVVATILGTAWLVTE